jgi:hypothetical protein
MYHVPYSEVITDEFQTPDGEWYATLRAIAFDGWLLWKHALPEDYLLWPQMTKPVFETIKILGQRIHNIHQLLPDYRRLSDTPFQVSCWWDPSDSHGEWTYGDRVLLRVNGYTARDIEHEVPARLRGQLNFEAVSTHWAEISLPEGPTHWSEAGETP